MNWRQRKQVNGKTEADKCNSTVLQKSAVCTRTEAMNVGKVL